MGSAQAYGTVVGADFHAHHVEHESALLIDIGLVLCVTAVAAGASPLASQLQSAVDQIRLSRRRW